MVPAARSHQGPTSGAMSADNIFGGFVVSPARFAANRG
jgi:hypothetical protein